MKNAVTYRFSAGVAYVNLSSPETGNALNRELIGSLNTALDQALTDDSCRAIVLRSDGADFCRGLDIAEAAASDGASAPEFAAASIDCLRAITQSPVPVIACVDGSAVGGGVGLAAACDVVLATTRASFMLSEVILGLVPALIAPVLLRRLTAKRLCYMMLSSRPIQGSEAREWGLVDELAGEGGIEAILNATLRRLLCSAPHALAECKRYVAELENLDFELQTAIASKRLRDMLADDGTRQALRLFADGETPPWFQKHRGVEA